MFEQIGTYGSGSWGDSEVEDRGDDEISRLYEKGAVISERTVGIRRRMIVETLFPSEFAFFSGVDVDAEVVGFGRAKREVYSPAASEVDWCECVTDKRMSQNRIPKHIEHIVSIIR